MSDDGQPPNRFAPVAQPERQSDAWHLGSQAFMRVTVNVTMTDQDRLQEADRSALGFTIRDGIVVIEKTTTLADRTIIEEPG